MGRTGYPIIVPQDFVGVNYGAMHVPAGRVGAAQLQAVLATPFQGPMHVHAVPIFFGKPKAAPTSTGNSSLRAIGGF
jgi:hypothetical protein